MEGNLDFDPGKAKELISALKKRKTDMENTLKDIKKLVKSSVEENWKGKSRDAFINQYNASSDKVVGFLEDWIKNLNQCIEDTTVLMDNNDSSLAKDLEGETQDIRTSSRYGKTAVAS